VKTETVDGVTLPKIGLGTWSFGGDWDANRSSSSDGRDLAALRRAIEIGYRHFDTAEVYSGGHSEELVGRAIRESGIARELVFVTTKVAPEHLAYESVLASCEGSLRRLGLDYIDLYLIHWPRRGAAFGEAFRALNELVETGKLRHLGVSNFKFDLLDRVRSLAATPILTDQVPYSLNDRSYVTNGVLEYCQRNEIVITAYSPLDQGKFKPSAAAREIAHEHKATTEQVALAWLIAQPKVIAIPMSKDAAHLRANWESQDLELSPKELEALDSS